MRKELRSKQVLARNLCLLLSILLIAGAGFSAIAFTNTAGDKYEIDIIDADPRTDIPPALAQGQTWTDKSVWVTDTAVGGFNVKLSALTRRFSTSEPWYDYIPHTFPGHRVVIMVDLSGSITEREQALKLTIELRDKILAVGRGKNEVYVVGFNSRTAILDIPANATQDDVNGLEYADTYVRDGSTLYYNAFDEAFANYFKKLGPDFTNPELGGTNIQLATFLAQNVLLDAAAAPGAETKTPSMVLVSDALPTFAYLDVVKSGVPYYDNVIGDGESGHRFIYKADGFDPDAPDLLDVMTMNQIGEARAKLSGLTYNIVKLNETAGFNPPLYRNADFAGTIYAAPADFSIWNPAPDDTAYPGAAAIETPLSYNALFTSYNELDPWFTTGTYKSIAVGVKYRFAYSLTGDPAVPFTVDFKKLSGYYSPTSPDATALAAKYTVQADYTESIPGGYNTYTHDPLTGNLVICDNVGYAFKVDKAAVEALAPAGTTIVYDEATRVLTWTIPAGLVPTLPATGDGTGLAPISVTFPVTFNPIDSNLIDGVLFYTNEADTRQYSGDYAYTAVSNNPFETGAKAGPLPNTGWMDLVTEVPPPSAPLVITSPSPSGAPPSDEPFEPSDPPMPPPPTGGTPYFLILGLFGAGLLTAGVVLSVKMSK